MKKKITLLIFLGALHLSFGQILTYDFAGATGNEATANSNFNDPAIAISTISRGAGLTAAANNNSFTATNWDLTSIANAVTGNDYMEFTITPNAGYEFSVSTITFNIRRNNNGLTGIALRSSLDGYASNIDGEKAIADNTNLQVISFNVSQAANNSAVTYRLYGYAETLAGQGRLKGSGNDIVVHGVISSTSASPCDITDGFSDATLGAQWTDVGGGSSIVNERLQFNTGSATGRDYIYQDITSAYNSQLNTLANTISWEFNMRQSRGNPNGFNDNGYGIAFILAGSNSDLTEGNGYAVVLGQPGNGGVDNVRLVSYTSGLDANANLTDIITGAADYGNDYLSIRVTFDAITNTWELFVRDDGSSFNDPASLNAGHSQGTVVNTTYINTPLDYIGVFFNHDNGANPNAYFDNVCIAASTTCATTSTWNGTTWSTGVPDLTTEAIINADYNTTTNGSFSACSLTVNAASRLTIDNNGYVEIQNDATVDGELFVETNGTFVQVSNTASVTENGTIRVIKTTSPLNVWYEYTYWSSPVSGEIIGDALTDSAANRRFSFNAANFLDATTENNNDNTTVAGQDDVDDDGNDWTFEAAANVMDPGVGYAATHSSVAFIGPPMTPPPYQFDYLFEGPFNNGIITVDVYRNDSELNDNNWNFLGNPYPSAIDADAFLAVNSILATDVNHPGALDGAIFLWSQNTPPSDTNNGNQNQNFEASDYAVINAVGQTAGGDGLTPDRYIPSGQGFFVVYSDAATPDSTTGDIAQGQVTFNNSMRVTANNTQFFRSSNSSSQIERLWLDLTSDNGIFNQILVAYANGATNDDDGMAYDTKKNLSTEVAAVLYSRISDSDNKYVIQAKDPSSLNEKETISIGFNTTIDVPTIYSLAIPQTQGDFLDKNDIFLKDNLLNTLHNLKDGAYNFTSETGEFNQRFEIVFSRDALSTNNHNVSEKSLIISEQTNGRVNFTLNAAYKMETIQIIDLQGKVIYNLNPNSKQATYNLSNLSQTPYIAKVTLDNKQTIIKKAIKQF